MFLLLSLSFENLKLFAFLQTHWPEDNAWFFGVVTDVDERKPAFKSEVLYDDGDLEWGDFACGGTVFILEDGDQRDVLWLDEEHPRLEVPKAGEKKTKRSRGRPRKIPMPEQHQEQQGTDDEDNPKKGPGRPRKTDAPSEHKHSLSSVSCIADPTRSASDQQQEHFNQKQQAQTQQEQQQLKGSSRAPKLKIIWSPEAVLAAGKSPVLSAQKERPRRGIKAKAVRQHSAGAGEVVEPQKTPSAINDVSGETSAVALPLMPLQLESDVPKLQPLLALQSDSKAQASADVPSASDCKALLAAPLASNDSAAADKGTCQAPAQSSGGMDQHEKQRKKRARRPSADEVDGAVMASISASTARDGAGEEGDLAAAEILSSLALGWPPSAEPQPKQLPQVLRLVEPQHHEPIAQASASRSKAWEDEGQPVTQHELLQPAETVEVNEDLAKKRKSPGDDVEESLEGVPEEEALSEEKPLLPTRPASQELKASCKSVRLRD